MKKKRYEKEEDVMQGAGGGGLPFINGFPRFFYSAIF